MLDWVTGFVESWGYVGIALLMFLENVFPPIPSELIMPLAGYTASGGQLNILLAIAAGVVGSIAGALLWYYVARAIGCERLRHWAGRHGRWLTLSPDEIDQATDWFRRQGGKAVFVGRLVPAVRTLISVPAGFAEMPLVPFLLYSLAGTVIWTGLLAGAGYWLGSSYDQVSAWLGPVSNVVVAGIVVWYVWRVWSFRPKQV